MRFGHSLSCCIRRFWFSTRTFTKLYISKKQRQVAAVFQAPAPTETASTSASLNLKSLQKEKPNSATEIYQNSWLSTLEIKKQSKKKKKLAWYRHKSFLLICQNTKVRVRSQATGTLRRRLQVSFFHIQYGQRRGVQLEISATKNSLGIQVVVKVSLFLSQRGAHLSYLAMFYSIHFGDIKQL